MEKTPCENGYFVLPDDVIEIPEGAFSNNKNLRYIDLRNVRYIGDRAFQDCTNLESVEMSEAVIIGQGAFEFCRSLRSIAADSITEIGDAAFFGCSLLDVPVFPRTIRSVGTGAFSHTAVKCADLHWLNEIPAYLFSCCTALTHVDIRGARMIGEKAFFGCRSLSHVRFDSAKSIMARAFFNCDSFELASLPETIQHIGDDAFSNIQEGIIIPKSVRHVGRDCFGPVDRQKKICIYESVLHEFRNYFRDDRRQLDEEDIHSYLWESSIDVTILDDETDKMIGFLPLFSDIDSHMRNELIRAFREDNTFDYQMLDTVMLDGVGWNQRGKDRLAIMRSKYPYGMSESARAYYNNYLEKHLTRIAQRAIRYRDIETLALLCDIDMIRKDTIPEILDYSIMMAAHECTAFLLERQSEMNGHAVPFIDEL